MLKKISIFLIFLYLSLFVVNSDTKAVHPKNSNGLKFESAFDLDAPGGQTFFEDEQGFLWMDSDGSGIYRYDGYELKNYGAGEGLLSNGSVWRIVEDSKDPHIFWIGTNEGLNRFDKKTETFTYYKHDPNDPNSIGDNGVLDVLQDGDDPDILWLATYFGFNKFDKTTGQAIRFEHDPEDTNSLGFPEVWRMVEDSSDTNVFWLATFGGGVDKFEKDSQTFTHYTYDPNNPNSLNSENGVIGFITNDKDNPEILWIGTDYGLDKFNKNTEAFTHYTHDPNDPTSITAGIVSLVYDDGDGNLWLGGYIEDNGLTVFDKETETFANYRYDLDDPNSLGDDYVVNVYKDKSDTIWITTYSGKVDKIDDHGQNFDLYQNNPFISNTLVNNVVNVVYESNDGMIWLGTQGGLSKFNPNTKEFINYTHNPNDASSLDSDYVLGIFEDTTGDFWVSLFEGPLVKLDKNTGKVLARYETEIESFTEITQDPNDSNILWLGARGGIGFAKFDKAQQSFTLYETDLDDPQKGPSHGYVFEILHDANQEIIWLATFGGGLNKFDKNTETFTHYKHNPDDTNSLAADNVGIVYQDPESGDLWIGTSGGGLDKFDPKTEKFTHFSEEQGLPSEVYAILRDDSLGNLWLSTNKGIIKFNPQTESVERRYNKSDGLQGDVFLHRSSLKTKNGDMWFGGTKGANSFHPDHIVTNFYKPPVVLTSLTSYGKKIEVNEVDNPSYIDEFKLSWQENSFEFEYAALNFTSSQGNQYQYFLEGYDKEWFDAGNNRFGRYSNLPGGSYTLRIKGSNSDGIWSDHEVAVKVNVSRPYWRTWWFYSIMVAIVVGLFVFIYQVKVNQLKSEAILSGKVQESSEMLEKTNKELMKANKELKNRARELEKMNKLMVGRELKMVELKKKAGRKS